MGRLKKVLSVTDIEIIKKEASDGQSVASIAAQLGIPKATLDRRVEENERVREALDQGRGFAIKKVSSVAFDMATSGKFPAMTMFWLKCFAGWSETQSSVQEDRQTITILTKELNA